MPDGERPSVLPQGAKGERLTPAERLRRRTDYLRCYRTGRRRHGPLAILYFAPNQLGHPRLGITASRKVGKAVERQRLKAEVQRLSKLFAAKFARQHDRMHALERRLEALSPLKVLARGYSITRLENGHVVTDVAEAPAGTKIRVLLKDEQELDAVVSGTRKKT